MFTNDIVNAVFSKYEQRRHSDEKLMADLGPAGFTRRDELGRTSAGFYTA